MGREVDVDLTTSDDEVASNSDGVVPDSGYVSSNLAANSTPILEEVHPNIEDSNVLDTRSSRPKRAVRPPINNAFLSFPTTLNSSKKRKGASLGSERSKRSKSKGSPSIEINLDDEILETIRSALPRSRRAKGKAKDAYVDEGDGFVEVDATPKIGSVKRKTTKPKSTVKSRSESMVFTGVDPGSLVNPKSTYHPFEPPHPIVSQYWALNNWLDGEGFVHGTSEDDDDIDTYLTIDNFVIYDVDNKRIRGEFTPLNNFMRTGKGKKMHVDGVVSNGVDRKYFVKLEINGSSMQFYTPVEIFVRTTYVSTLPRSHKHERVWFRLLNPEPEYVRYYTPILWQGNLGRYFLEYLDDYHEKAPDTNIRLWHFKEDFCGFLKHRYAGDKYFEDWLVQYHRNEDFRPAINAYSEVLWSHATNIIENPGSSTFAHYSKHVLWSEVFLTAITPATKRDEAKTVVTPYVYNLFKHIFSKYLKVVVPPKPVQIMDCVAIYKKPAIELDVEKKAQTIAEQLVIGCIIEFDAQEGNSVWKTSKGSWYGYVTDIHERKGTREVSIIWMYRPEDTVLYREKYPYDNELFFSNHCNCYETDKIKDYEICRILKIDWLPKDVTKLPKDVDFFVRQTYMHDVAGFITYKHEHRQCECRAPEKTPFELVKQKYALHDTVLVEELSTSEPGPDGCTFLEAAEIVEFDEETKTVSLKRLERRKRFDPSARPNELLVTDTVINRYDPELVHHKCHVRVYGHDEDVQDIYDRNGTCDCFFVRDALAAGHIVPLEGPVSFIQGYEFWKNLPGGLEKLRGMDLFCGGGNFGRGLEEGGAIEMKWAVEIDNSVFHTYRANMADPSKTALFLGSVNNYNEAAILKKYSNLVPRPEEVDFISAGSPCQGFSLANPNKGSEKSLQNCSLVASVATAVDVFRPRYALLENVPTMGSDMSGTGNNVFCQLICAVVGMGYQVESSILDAWSFGSSQLRTRLFVVIAAPGEPFPSRPPRSHSHRSSTKSRALYEGPSGEKFAARYPVGPVSYPFVSCREDLSDLPDIGDAHVGICIEYPDHRPSRVENWGTRHLMGQIPREPAGQGYYHARKRGKLSVLLENFYTNKSKDKESCKAWKRTPPDGLSRTVTTSITPQCSNTGMCMHYDQPRLWTVQECRRQQGFPDSEVLVSEPAKQMHVVGNSVARTVALAWGMAFRKALMDGGGLTGKGVENGVGDEDHTEEVIEDAAGVDETAILRLHEELDHTHEKSSSDEEIVPVEDLDEDEKLVAPVLVSINEENDFESEPIVVVRPEDDIETVVISSGEEDEINPECERERERERDMRVVQISSDEEAEY